MTTTVNPELAKLPFSAFKKWHDKFMPTDTMTAEERYKDLGGKIPEKRVTKDKPSQ
jgi:hypothetical protein